MGLVKDVTDDSFQAEVLEAEQPVLVDFWATWCAPCRMVAPVLEEIAGENADLKIVKIDVEANPKTTSAYGIIQMPTMILFKHGQPAAQISGAYPKRALLKQLEPALA